MRLPLTASEFVKLLGFDEDLWVRSATIRLEPDSLVVIDAEIIIGFDGDELTTALRRYELVEREPE